MSPTPTATQIICMIETKNTSEFDTHTSSAETIVFHLSLKKFRITIRIQFKGINITTTRLV